MIDPGESVLAAFGLRRLLDGDRVPVSVLRRARELEAEAADAIRGYLAGDPAEDTVTELSHVETLPEALPEDAERVVQSLPEEAVVPTALAAARALAHLRGVITERSISGLARRPASPTAAELAQRRRAAAAIENPIGLLGDLDGLSVDHVAAIRAVYPSLYAAIGVMVGEAIVDAARPLSSREEATLSRLLGVPLSGLESVARTAQEEQAQGASPAQPSKPAVSDLTTPVQRIAFG